MVLFLISKTIYNCIVLHLKVMFENVFMYVKVFKKQFIFRINNKHLITVWYIRVLVGYTKQNTNFKQIDTAKTK